MRIDRRTRNPEELDPMWWHARAACRSYPTDVFFPTHEAAYPAAKAVCATCEVRQECLGYALRHNQWAGCWGGLTPEERRHLEAGE